MGMSTHVVGFRPPDERYARMKAVYDACEAASVAAPDEVADFFVGEPPDYAGIEVEIRDATTEWEGESDAGIDVDLRKLPADVHIVRFVTSW